MGSIANFYAFIQVFFAVIFFKEQVICSKANEEDAAGDADRFPVGDQTFKQAAEGIGCHNPKNITEPYAANKIKCTCKAIIYPQLNDGKNYRPN